VAEVALGEPTKLALTTLLAATTRPMDVEVRRATTEPRNKLRRESEPLAQLISFLAVLIFSYIPQS
jgi:hypothetical protein